MGICGIPLAPGAAGRTMFAAWGRRRLPEEQTQEHRLAAWFILNWTWKSKMEIPVCRASTRQRQSLNRPGVRSDCDSRAGDFVLNASVGLDFLGMEDAEMPVKTAAKTLRAGTNA